MVNKELKLVSISLKNFHLDGLFVSYVGSSCIDLIVPFDYIILVADVALQRGYSLQITGYSSSSAYFCKIHK